MVHYARKRPGSRALRGQAEAAKKTSERVTAERNEARAEVARLTAERDNEAAQLIADVATIKHAVDNPESGETFKAAIVLGILRAEIDHARTHGDTSQRIILSLTASLVTVRQSGRAV